MINETENSEDCCCDPSDPDCCGSSKNACSQEATENADCCALFYEKPWVREIMGDSFHPGGKDLTLSVLQDLELSAGKSLVDLACGPGTAAILACEHFSIHATGIDASVALLDIARAEGSGYGERLMFTEGRAEALPFLDAAFDAGLCECAVSTFPDQLAVAKELFRVLKPGGRLGITDMVVNGTLPPRVRELMAPWTCLAEARTVMGYETIFKEAGFDVLKRSDESIHLKAMVRELKRKLLVYGLARASGYLAELNLTLKDLREIIREGEELVDAGTLQYCRLVFEKPHLYAHGS